MPVTEEEKDEKLSTVGNSVDRRGKKLKTPVDLAVDEDRIEFHPPPTKRRMIQQLLIDGDSIEFLPPQTKRRKVDINIERSAVDDEDDDDDVKILKTIQYIDLYPLFQ